MGFGYPFASRGNASKPLRSVGFGGRSCTLGPTAKDPLGNGPVKKALGALGEKKGRISAAFRSGSGGISQEFRARPPQATMAKRHSVTPRR